MRTNTKQVQDQVKQHVLDQIESVEILRANMDAAWSQEIPNTNYHKALRLAQWGEFLISYFGERNFLNSLDINPQNKEYTDEQVDKLYNHLVAKQCAKIVGEGH